MPNNPFAKTRRWIVSYDVLIGDQLIKDQEMTIAGEKTIFDAIFEADIRIRKMYVAQVSEGQDLWLDIWEICQVDDEEGGSDG